MCVGLDVGCHMPSYLLSEWSSGFSVHFYVRWKCNLLRTLFLYSALGELM